MFATPPANRNIFSVSKLNRLVRSLLESEIGQIWLSAEISNFVSAASGHWYFTLKDERAQVKCAMFRNANRRVIQRPKEGDKVLVRANLSLYEPRGDYQLIVEHMEADGEGLLKQQFEQLKIKLSAEGLFAQQSKQPLPESISRIGVVTSPTGAAFHDILTVLGRRNPSVEVILYPSQVQGDTAAQQICHAIETANRRNEVDVLIVGRGGGSLEDLWCFNEESVARAVFNSQLPVVSAVGHEIDITISDFVADLRAPTPSAAAELTTNDQSELADKIRLKTNALHQSFHLLLKDKHQSTMQSIHKLEKMHPRHQLTQQSQRLDYLQTKLSSAMQQQLQTDAHRVNSAEAKLKQQTPAHKLNQARQSHAENARRLMQAWQKLISRANDRLASNAHLLDTVSPLATLARGYSITYHDNNIVTSAEQLSPNDVITTRLKNAEVSSQVMEVKPLDGK